MSKIQLSMKMLIRNEKSAVHLLDHLIECGMPVRGDSDVERQMLTTNIAQTIDDCVQEALEQAIDIVERAWDPTYADCIRQICSDSSVVEHPPCKREAAGSIPCSEHQESAVETEWAGQELSTLGTPPRVSHCGPLNAVDLETENLIRSVALSYGNSTHCGRMALDWLAKYGREASNE